MLRNNKLPYRFRHGLVNCGRGDGTSGDDGVGSGDPDGNDGDVGNDGGVSSGGDGYGPDGLVDLGSVRGGFSSIDENGKFTGVVDPDLGFFGRVAANFATNLNRSVQNLSSKSLMSKIGITTTAISAPGLVAIAGIALGVKSLAQALSAPGITEADKAGIKSAADKISSMSPKDKAALGGEFKSMGGVTDQDITNEQLFETDEQAEQAPVSAFDRYLDEFYDTAKQEFLYKAGKINEGVDRQNDLINNSQQDLTDLNSVFRQDLTDLNSVFRQDLTDSNSEFRQDLTDSNSEFRQEASSANDEIQRALSGLNDNFSQTSQANLDELRHWFPQQRDNYTQSLTDANNEYQTSRTESLNTQDEILRDLMGGLEEGNNLNPLSFEFGGQNVSFIPGANRATANQIAAMGQQNFNNSTGTADSIFNADQGTAGDIFDAESAVTEFIYNAGQDTAQGQFDVGSQTANDIFDAGNQTANDIFDAGNQTANDIFDAGNQTANDIFDAGNQTANDIFDAGTQTTQDIVGLGQTELANTAVGAQTNGQLDYLDALKDVAGMELNQEAVDKGLAIQQQNADTSADANETSIADILTTLAVASNSDKNNDLWGLLS